MSTETTLSLVSPSARVDVFGPTVSLSLRTCGNGGVWGEVGLGCGVGDHVRIKFLVFVRTLSWDDTDPFFPSVERATRQRLV